MARERNGYSVDTIIFERLKSIATVTTEQDAFYRGWYRDGMVCVQSGARVFEVKDRSRLPSELDRLGGGGWTAAGVLDWIGFDLDVGHGREAVQYASTDEAIAAGREISALCNGAGEIRLSKSGVGVHIRVRVRPIDLGDETAARKMARNAAYWVAAACQIKCDRTVLGRQNLWYAAREVGVRGFELIDAGAGVWSVPKAAMQPPGDDKPAVSAPRVSAPVSQDRRAIIERAAMYMRKVDHAVAGQGGNHQAYVAACKLVQGYDITPDEAEPIYREWCAGNKPPTEEYKIREKLEAAYKAPNGKFARGHLLNAVSPHGGHGGGAVSKGYDGRRAEIEIPADAFAPSTVAPPPVEQDHGNGGAGLDAGFSGDAGHGEGEIEGAASPVISLGRVAAEETEALNEWFDADFHSELAKISLASNTKRDAMAARLFDALSLRLPKVGSVTQARVKENVRSVLKIGASDYKKALIEADTRRAARSDSGWLALAEKYKEFLWRGSVKRVIRRWREVWYEWRSDEGCYLQQSDEWIQGEALLWLYDNGVDAAGAGVSNFLQAFMATSIIRENVKPGSWLKDAPIDAKGSIYFSMKNGILNLCNRARMIAHTPDYFTLNSAPYDFLPELDFEKWEKLALMWQPLDSTGAAFKILQDWLGYLFIPFNPWKKFLICTGPGNDGKSVYSAICKHIIGERNCSAVGLEAFDPKTSFGLEPMIGKMLNQIGDANMVDRVAEGTLKTMTGNDSQNFSRKFLPAITEVWPGKIMINANQTPYWRDRSNALFNRMLPLHWEPIPDDKINPNLVEELVAGDLPAIFNWAMIGFDRIRKEKFQEDGRVKDWLEEARSETQGELDFFDVCLGYDVDAGTLRKCYMTELMKAYREWCESRNVKAFCNDLTLGRQMHAYLRRRFKADKVAEDAQTEFFARLVGRDGSGTLGTHKRRKYYRGVWILE